MKITVLLEDKAALALHYRMAPSLRVAAEELIVQLIVDRNDLHYLAGNMVFEIKPRSVDKGVAITLSRRTAIRRADANLPAMTLQTRMVFGG